MCVCTCVNSCQPKHCLFKQIGSHVAPVKVANLTARPHLLQAAHARARHVGVLFSLDDDDQIGIDRHCGGNTGAERASHRGVQGQRGGQKDTERKEREMMKDQTRGVKGQKKCHSGSQRGKCGDLTAKGGRQKGCKDEFRQKGLVSKKGDEWSERRSDMG